MMHPEDEEERRSKGKKMTKPNPINERPKDTLDSLLLDVLKVIDEKELIRIINEVKESRQANASVLAHSSERQTLPNHSQKPFEHNSQGGRKSLVPNRIWEMAKEI